LFVGGRLLIGLFTGGVVLTGGFFTAGGPLTTGGAFGILGALGIPGAEGIFEEFGVHGLAPGGNFGGAEETNIYKKRFLPPELGTPGIGTDGIEGIEEDDEPPPPSLFLKLPSAASLNFARFKFSKIKIYFTQRSDFISCFNRFCII